ncbi:MAG: membrane protein insertion efficiency factor YidD [Dehalococcoidia bacterium]
MLQHLLLSGIRVYQRAVSPSLPSACRFEPTCSRYAYMAIEHFGARRGVWLAVRRLARCTPLTAQRYDPVPERVSRETQLPSSRSFEEVEHSV